MRPARVAAVLAVVVLFVNDHLLKHAFPGLVTGKLSDVAGMIFFPVLLAALCWPLVVFTLTKTTALGNEAYRVVWGALQWPVRALAALAHGQRLPRLARVVLVRDPSDVLAAPFVLLAYAAGRRGGQLRLLSPSSSRSPS